MLNCILHYLGLFQLDCKQFWPFSSIFVHSAIHVSHFIPSFAIFGLLRYICLLTLLMQPSLAPHSFTHVLVAQSPITHLPNYLCLRMSKKKSVHWCFMPGKMKMRMLFFGTTKQSRIITNHYETSRNQNQESSARICGNPEVCIACCAHLLSVRWPSAGSGRPVTKASARTTPRGITPTLSPSRALGSLGWQEPLPHATDGLESLPPHHAVRFLFALVGRCISVELEGEAEVFVSLAGTVGPELSPSPFLARRGGSARGSAPTSRSRGARDPKELFFPPALF